MTGDSDKSGLASSAVALTSEKSPAVSKDTEIAIEGIASRLLKVEISSALNKVMAYIITGVIVLAVGAGAGVSWGLNGSVREALGKLSVSKEIADFLVDEYKKKNLDLEKKNIELEASVEHLKCLNNDSIKNKGECSK